MSTSSDPERGGQEPDDRSREGQSAGGPVPPPGGQPTAGGPEQPGQYQPGQYPPGQYPQPGQYGQYGQYGQPGQPGQYGQYDQPGQPGQYGPPGLYDPHQPPSHGQPYGDRGGYVYSPYGTMPAGLPENDENAPVSRPGIMVLALVLLVLSALPWLLAGVSALANPDPLVPFIVTPEQFDQLRAQGVEPASVVRVLGTVLLIGALLYTMFAALAFSGRNWARIVLAIMTAGFTLLLLGSAVLASAAELGIVLIVVIAAVAGTVILFLPGPSRYITGRRR